MGFFNKKEQVFHIELTPHGRYLMSIGKLKPHHYKFFDDDVVYDLSHTSRVELQNDTHKRILNETPKIMQNANINGLKKHNSMSTPDFEVGVQLENHRFESVERNMSRMSKELGTIRYDSEQSPGLKIDLFNGTIKKATKFLTSSSTPTQTIPQIDIDIEYRYKVMTEQEASSIDNTIDYKKVYKSNPIDGKVVVVTPEIPLIRIKSEGAFDQKENYEISVFKAQDVSGSLGSFYPMKFSHKMAPIVNGILVETQERQDTDPAGFELAENETPSRYDTKNDEVEYFFEIVTDRQIPNEDICSTVGELKVRNIYLDEKVDCEDIVEEPGLNLYSSRVRPEDLRNCD